MDNCIFCKIAGGQVATNFLFSDEEIIAFNDLHPQAPHHVLIIPRQHIETVAQVEESNAYLLGRMIITAHRLAEELGFAKNGYRLVVNCRGDGGQEIYHLHLHLLGGRKLKWPPG